MAVVVPLALRFLFARNPRVAFSTALGTSPVHRGCPRHCSDEFEKTWQKKMLIVNMKIATGVFSHQVSSFTRTTSSPSLSLFRDFCDFLLFLSLFFFASLNIRRSYDELTIPEATEIS